MDGELFEDTNGRVQNGPHFTYTLVLLLRGEQKELRTLLLLAH